MNIQINDLPVIETKLTVAQMSAVVGGGLVLSE